MDDLPSFNNKIKIPKELNNKINMIVKYQNNQLKNELKKIVNK